MINMANDSTADRRVSLLDLKMADEAFTLPTRPVAAVHPFKKALAARAGRLTARLIVLLVLALLSLGVYSIISRNFFQSVQVVGESMVPTLNQGSHYILNRLAYRNSPPQRGDIVVIHDPGDHGYSVKRVIAVAGESVHFLNGKVYVNGEPLDEPYLLPGTHTFTYSRAQEQLITCGQDHYFVLGDNRLVSVDSRSYGPVDRQDILGRVVLHK